MALTRRYSVVGPQTLVDFQPPEIVFGFEYELVTIVYASPQVAVTIGFEFTASFKFGVQLDTSGIREAIEQNAPEKALNSFALMDTFDGVDEAMLTVSAGVTVEVSVSAAVVKIGAYGGVTVVATIDLYDPAPETSGGLIRPFELLSSGSSPLEWFEFGVSISVNVGVFIEVCQLST